MTSEQYSGLQRLSFAMLLVGFLLCCVGSVPHMWFVGEFDMDSEKIIGWAENFCGFNIGEGEYATWNEIDVGLWYQCCFSNAGNGCKSYQIDGDTKSFLVRIFNVLNLTLAFISITAPAACGCLCKGGRTLGHGILAFFSGVFGLAAVATFVHSNQYDANKYSLMAWFTSGFYAWALYVYLGGSALITFVSFHLCLQTAESKLPTLPVLNKLPKLPEMSNILEQFRKLPKLSELPKLPFTVKINWRENRYATVEQEPTLITTAESCSTQADAPPAELPTVA